MPTKITPEAVESRIDGHSNTTSVVPISYSKKMGTRLLATHRLKHTGEKAMVLTQSFKFFALKPEFPDIVESQPVKSMWDHCGNMDKQWHTARETQDTWTVTSHHKLAIAYARGFFPVVLATITPCSLIPRLRNLSR